MNDNTIKLVDYLSCLQKNKAWKYICFLSIQQKQPEASESYQLDADLKSHWMAGTPLIYSDILLNIEQELDQVSAEKTLAVVQGTIY